MAVASRSGPYPEPVRVCPSDKRAGVPRRVVPKPNLHRRANGNYLAYAPGATRKAVPATGADIKRRMGVNRGAGNCDGSNQPHASAFVGSSNSGSTAGGTSTGTSELSGDA